ncbi:MAG: hypothetical protein C0490_28840, partial [Marivirga sp.]|nr:hypothetical protein [Marivirga sp.]
MCMIKKMFLTVLLCAGISIISRGQEKNDTIIVELARTSKVIFTIKDRSDLETLKHYNFQELFQDILTKLEANDTSALPKHDSATVELATVPDKDEDEDEDWNLHSRSYDDDEDDDEDDDNDNWNVHHVRGNRWGRTWQSFNFDLGTNNYLSDGKFPDSNNELYSVRPWGSWYV